MVYVQYALVNIKNMLLNGRSLIGVGGQSSGNVSDYSEDNSDDESDI